MQTLSALAIQTRTGDAQARSEFFLRLRPDVRALAAAPECVPVAASALLDPSDLTHNVVLRITQSLDTFRGSSDQEFRAWVRKIVRNLAIDSAHSGDPTVPWADNGDSPGLNGHPVADDSTPSEKLLRAERILQVAGALARLPDDQQHAIRWRYIDGLPLEEIGRRLGDRSTDAAAQLIHRGKCRLRELLREYE